MPSQITLPRRKLSWATQDQLIAAYDTANSLYSFFLTYSPENNRCWCKYAYGILYTANKEYDPVRYAPSKAVKELDEFLALISAEDPDSVIGACDLLGGVYSFCRHTQIDSTIKIFKQYLPDTFTSISSFNDAPDTTLKRVTDWLSELIDCLDFQISCKTVADSSYVPPTPAAA